MPQTLSKPEDGIYLSNNIKDVLYYIKDGKIIIKFKQTFYRANSDFVLDATRQKPLTDLMITSFESQYSKCKIW